MTFIPTHKQVHTTTGALVDEGIATLLEALWARGLRTESSCQGIDDGCAYICFNYAFDARLFAKYAPGSHLTEGDERAWVDFPPADIDALASFWTNRQAA